MKMAQYRTVQRRIFDICRFQHRYRGAIDSVRHIWISQPFQPRRICAIIFIIFELYRLMWQILASQSLSVACIYYDRLFSRFISVFFRFHIVEAL